jgi:hypothetical protein
MSRPSENAEEDDDDLDLSPVESHTPGARPLTPLEILKNRSHPDLIRGIRERRARIVDKNLLRDRDRELDHRPGVDVDLEGHVLRAGNLFQTLRDQLLIEHRRCEAALRRLELVEREVAALRRDQAGGPVGEAQPGRWQVEEFKRQIQKLHVAIEMVHTRINKNASVKRVRLLQERIEAIEQRMVAPNAGEDN